MQAGNELEAMKGINDELTRIIADQTRRIRALEQALRPFAAYAKSRREQPLIGLGDIIHTIHPGTQWEAEITLRHCMTAEKALER